MGFCGSERISLFQRGTDWRVPSRSKKLLPFIVTLSSLRVYKFEPRDKRRSLFHARVSPQPAFLSQTTRPAAGDNFNFLFILRSFGIRLDRLYRYFICSFLGCARCKNSPADAYLGRAVSTSARANWWKTPLSFVNFDAEHSQHQLPGWSTDTFLALHCQIPLFSIHKSKFYKNLLACEVPIYESINMLYLHFLSTSKIQILLVVSACVCL